MGKRTIILLIRKLLTLWQTHAIDAHIQYLCPSHSLRIFYVSVALLKVMKAMKNQRSKGQGKTIAEKSSCCKCTYWNKVVVFLLLKFFMTAVTKYAYSSPKQQNLAFVLFIFFTIFSLCSIVAPWCRFLDNRIFTPSLTSSHLAQCWVYVQQIVC